MSKHGGRRVDRRTAERLLRGVPVDVPDALAGLLAAAAAPPRDGELGGEPAVLAAFEAARHVPIPPPRSPSMIKTTLAKLLTVKVAAAAVAIFAVGGVATAAATGALPLPAGGSAPATSASSLPAATGSSDAPASTRGQGKTRAENEPSPSPSLTGLCHAYTAGNKAEHGKALESPAFTALVTAAGGMTKVDDYCITLLKDESAKPVHTDSPEPTAAPGHSGDDHGAGADHPTGAPATHPTGPPTTHPTR